jgi:hypothetical protein
MRQVGAEFAQHTTHPSQDKIALTAAAVAAMKRKPRRPGDLVRDAGLPVVRFVPSKKNPRTGFDGVGIRDRRPKKAVDRLYIQHHLVAPYSTSADAAGCGRCQDRAQSVWAAVFAAHGPTSLFSPTRRGALADLSRCKRLPSIAVNCTLVWRQVTAAIFGIISGALAAGPDNAGYRWLGRPILLPAAMQFFDRHT